MNTFYFTFFRWGSPSYYDCKDNNDETLKVDVLLQYLKYRRTYRYNLFIERLFYTKNERIITYWFPLIFHSCSPVNSKIILLFLIKRFVIKMKLISAFPQKKLGPLKKSIFFAMPRIIPSLRGKPVHSIT